MTRPTPVSLPRAHAAPGAAHVAACERGPRYVVHGGDRAWLALLLKNPHFLFYSRSLLEHYLVKSLSSHLAPSPFSSLPRSSPPASVRAPTRRRWHRWLRRPHQTLTALSKEPMLTSTSTVSGGRQDGERRRCPKLPPRRRTPSCNGGHVPVSQGTDNMNELKDRHQRLTPILPDVVD